MNVSECKTEFTESSHCKEKLIPILRQGLPYKNRNVDYDIWKWRISLMQTRDGKLVSKNEVQTFARDAYKSAGINNFKASDGWYRRWLHRWGNNSAKSSCKNKKQNRTTKDKASTNGSVKSKNKKVPPEVNNSDVSFSTENDVKMNLAIDSNISIDPEPSVNNSIDTNSNNIGKENEESSSKILQTADIEGHNLNTNKPEQHSNSELVKRSIFNELSLSLDSCTMDEFFYASIIDNEDEYSDIISKTFNFNKTINFKSNDIINSILSCQDKYSVDKYSVDKYLKSSIAMENENDHELSKINSNELKNNQSDVKLKLLRKGERYLPNFKAKVTKFAVSNDIKTAASKFNVNRGTISDWLKEKNKNKKSRIKVVEESLATEHDDAPDVSFIKWLECNCDKLNNQMIVKKTLEIYEKYDEVTLRKTCPWFLAYIKRLNKKTFSQKPCDKKYILYPESFKILVAQYAKSYSQLAAARLFVIARKRVFEWLSKLNATGTIKPKDPTNSAAYVTDPKIDAEILKWYKEQAVAPTSKQVREKGRLLYKKAGYAISCSHGWYYRWRRRLGLSMASSEYTAHDASILEWILTKLDNNQNISHNEILDFASKLKKSKASLKFNSLGWVLRFCKRYPLLLRSVPDVTTTLPPSMENKVKIFKDDLRCYIKEENISLNNIVLMDEIPLHFLVTGNSKRKMLIRRPGFDTCLGSLIVSSTADGVILPFLLIMKGPSQSLTESRGPKGCITTSDKGQMDEHFMKMWLQEICFKQTMEQGMLINDSLVVHTNTSVLELLTENKVKHFVIPGGCSSRLQPLNKITTRIKNNVELLWEELVAAKCWTDSNSRLKLPNHDQIFDWVQKSFMNIACERMNIIKEAFDEIYDNDV